MKKLLVSLIMLLPVWVLAQSEKNSHPFEPIQLYFVMLIKGANRTQDSATAARIQDGHLANIGRLTKEGKLLVAGPFMDDVNWRGILILKCKDSTECVGLLKTDPAITSGRLSYEFHPWMTGKNCLFK